MEVRFFGSMDCIDCLLGYVLLNKYNINYEFIDALDEADSIQDFCDEQNVEELPHFQFIINNRVVLEHIGSLVEEELVKYIEIIKKDV